MCLFTCILESLKECYIFILEDCTPFSILSVIHLHIPFPMVQHPWDLVLYAVSRFQVWGRERALNLWYSMTSSIVGKPATSNSRASDRGLNSSRVGWLSTSQNKLQLSSLSAQEYWSGLPFPPAGDISNPGIKLSSPALADGFFTTGPPGAEGREVIPDCSGPLCDFERCCLWGCGWDIQLHSLWRKSQKRVIYPS